MPSLDSIRLGLFNYADLILCSDMDFNSSRDALPRGHAQDHFGTIVDAAQKSLWAQQRELAFMHHADTTVLSSGCGNILLWAYSEV